MTLIYENDEIQVLFHDAPGSRLLITFAPFDFKADGEAFWGKSFVQKAGRATLGFVAKRRNWFPVQAVHASQKAIDPIIGRFANVMTYGASMGGYGALKFARFLNADCAVAFAPQYSIDPADGVTKHLFTCHFDPAVNAGMCIKKEDLCGCNFVVFDPLFDFDQRNFWFLRGLSHQVIPVRAFGAGHQCVWLIAQHDRANAFLDACQNLGATRARAQIARYRRLSPVRAEPVIRKLAATHPGWAMRLYDRYHEQFTDKSPLALGTRRPSAGT